MLPDLAGLVAALEGGEVGLVVIGAVALGAHGHIRATQDLDIVPEPRHDNLDRLGNVRASLDARLSADQRRGIDSELRQALYTGRNLTLTTRLGDHDVVQQLTGVPPWRALADAAEQTTRDGVPLAVCSREHLIAMTQVRHSLQDQADIAALLAEG